MKIANVGDKVRIVNPICVDSAYNHGDVLEVVCAYQKGCDVILKDSRTCFVYNCEYEVVEDAKEINWQVGQVVWDVVYGNGEVVRVDNSFHYPIGVRFNTGRSEGYTLEGKVYEMAERTLFFSEPIITAELYPPKKPFVPTFKKGDTAIAKRKDGQNTVVFYVVTEYEDIISSSGATYKKSEWNFYKLGEEVKFI